MRAIGLDIGTTTLSAVRMDATTGEVHKSLTVPNDTFVAGEPWARLQDPGAILSKARAMIDALMDGERICCIGLTGQMHGIVYADEAGNALSPLYTWQDGRGDLPMADGRSYARALSAETGRPLATGYGAVTHFYNLQNGLAPAGARWAMTIHDYIGMRLTGRTEPLIHASDAASLGAPDWPELASFLRVTDKTECLGALCGVPVAVAIGDNQASFIGSVREPERSVLINIGTGGQVSLACDSPAAISGCEARPLTDGATLLVGFSLCAGRSYALLERCFREIAVLGGAQDAPMYEAMNRLADLELDDPLSVRTTFSGTRQRPEARGSIDNIGTQNLTAAHLVQGVLSGMVDELRQPYLRMLPHTKKTPTVLVGSGNGLLKNPALKRLFEQTFGMAMVSPAHQEEAAYGAALFALAASGARPSLAEAQKLIRYLADPAPTA